MQTYSAEAAGRRPPTLRLTPLKRELFDHTHAICEWRMGRDSLAPADATKHDQLTLLNNTTPLPPTATIRNFLARAASMTSREQS